MRMIHGIHRLASNLRPPPHPALASGLSERDVTVLDVAYLTNRRVTVDVDLANLAARQPELRPVALFCHKLSRSPGRSHHLRSFAGPQLDVVNRRSKRNSLKRKSVP